LNLPSSIKDLSKIYAVKDTIDSVLALGLRVVLISHYKRPKPEDVFTQKFSLSGVVDDISEVLGRDVQFIGSSIFETSPDPINSDIVLLENLRFYEGETQNDDDFAKVLASFGDVYVNDAFSVSHRKHASVCAINKFIPSFPGLSLLNEIEWLSKLMSSVSRPYTAIIGGSKVSTKMDVLKQLSQTADCLVIAGAMANTFLAAQGFDMRQSAIETDLIDVAIEIMKLSAAEIIFPVDFLAAPNIESPGMPCKLNSVPEGYSCFDIGENTVGLIQNKIARSKTLLWNGALGAFEFSNFDASTKVLASFISEQTLHGNIISIVGGGETIASLGPYKKHISFTSTAGGAFLEFIAGYDLPGLANL
jgi:phosphoglycerate kinase